jgi:hypothetical protein
MTVLAVEPAPTEDEILRLVEDGAKALRMLRRQS